MATGVAPRFVAAKDDGAAVGDGLEHSTLGRRRHRAIAGQIRIAILSDDISHFQPVAGHGW